ncbi:MAG: ABC transporter ATP-binding protein [Planctomycetota bacterium]|jgi:branched-chain amino acid transport system ATP-binding protein|nr:ABC transporter ATP-binding protein [Planctomycetota bacterium]
MLEVENLRVHYCGIRAVKDVTFRVTDREIVAVIGSNGAGKSSSLMSISNVVRKAGGAVRFAGQDITSADPADIVRLGIGHVPEGRHIFPFLTVEENLILGDTGRTGGGSGRANASMEMVYSLFPRLADRRRQPGGTLSGGEQQMLAIGRGLMLDPKLLMFDEPSLGLAPIVVEEIFDLLLKIRAMGKTILLVEQNANMALQIADRAYVIETGRIALSGKAADLRHDPKVASAYLGI